MKYRFERWQHGIGNPDELVTTCNWVKENLPERDGQGSSREPELEIVFKIVDVRPGVYEDNDVNTLVENLTKLMLCDPTIIATLDDHAQLLFIGATPSLGERATDEREDGELRRDLKRDVEFAIRTLRSYGAATYGCIDADVSNDHHSLEQLPLTCSGIRLFESYYRDVLSSDTSSSSKQNTKYKRGIEVRKTLERIRSDFRKLLHSARALPEFSRLGALHAGDPSCDDEFNLLREIGILFELGKGERPIRYSPKTRLEQLARVGALTLDEPEYAHSSYKLFVDTLDKVAKWVGEYQPTSPSPDSALVRRDLKGQSIELGMALDMFKLERFNLLRDFGRVLGQGALPRLKEWGHGTRQILIIDDWLFKTLCEEKERLTVSKKKRVEPKAEMRLVDRLRQAIKVGFGSRAYVRIIHSSAIGANGEFGARHFADILGFRQVEPFHRVFDLNPIDHNWDWKLKLEDFAVVLIDPESITDELGPIRVHRLAKYFEQVRRAPPVVHGIRQQVSRPTPPIIAFSQRESSGYVQQCLNMGASAFAVKHRPYHLLFDLARVLRDPATFRDDTSDASQFRLLRGLKPHVESKLKLLNAPFYIHGGAEHLRGDVEFHQLQRNWVQALPKADLHYHLGTAIDLGTIAMLALNTAGYFFSSACENGDGAQLNQTAQELLCRTVFAVQLAADLAKLPQFRMIPPIELLAAAAHGVRPDSDLKWCSFGLGDAIVDQLHIPNERCNPPHATALLVAAIDACSASMRKVSAAAEGCTNNETSIEERFAEIDMYLNHLANVMTDTDKSDPLIAADQCSFDAKIALKLEANRTHRHYQRLGFRWAGEASLASMNALITANEREFWKELNTAFKHRVEMSKRALAEMINAVDTHRTGVSDTHQRPGHPFGTSWSAASLRAREWLKANWAQIGELDAAVSSPPSLKSYVAVTSEKGRRSLQLYLRGADLLGSSHLQYPENLLIAAYAITRDNVLENIIYSEVRCETTGFAKAGMGAHEATEMLRHGFNMASLFWASQRDSRHDTDFVPQSTASSSYPNERHFPLVRTNILLAAKRHKSEQEARAVVELLDHYLERRPFDPDRGWSRAGFHKMFDRSIPSWWRPCEVVGFDVSGNEAVNADWLEDIVAQLASRSSPVTIHAGEAASAESIWHAVYKLNALRIGHGLRLGENLALLGYCVREGICMELCPNSNFHTNAFRPPTEANRTKRFERGELYAYPLRRYMQHGMEVTIGTDNRYLHPDGARSLTSEYMMAARLVGGLTRWEVLQIVKAGFKNAFLDKMEVKELVGAAEEAIYRIIASDKI